MSGFLRLCTLVIFSVVLAGPPWARGANLVTNGEFSDGTVGWGVTGTIFTTGQTAVLSDQGGLRVALFQSVPIPVEVTVSLRLGFDFFIALSPVVSLGRTPDSFFGTVFTGEEAFGGSYEDGVYDDVLGLLDADYRGAVNLPAGMTVTASPKGAGWTRHSLALPVVSFVTVGFEFIDGNAVVGDSSALIDNVTLIAEPIPEPGVAGLLLMAATALGWRRRRTATGGHRHFQQAPPPVAASATGWAGSRRKRRVMWSGGFGVWLGVVVGSLQAQVAVPPVLDPSLVQVTAAAERSTLERTGGQLTSTVDLEITNIGTARIDGPVHALVRFRNAVTGAEVRSGVNVRDSVGGIDQPPHQVPFFDLSAQVADGWMPGAVLTRTLVFTRARTLNVLYEVAVTGYVNRPPVLEPGGPYAGLVGAPIVFEAVASDPDGDTLEYQWDFGDGTSAETARAEHVYATAGAKSLRIMVNDGRGGVAERDVTAVVIPDGDFALAHTRVVNAIGHPVGGAIIEETGPDGVRTLEAAASGFISLGTTEGAYVWKFSAPGHRPVWRTAALTNGEVRLVPSPWLAREGEEAAVSVLDDTVLSTGSGPGRARLVFPGGAFTQPGAARLTGLGSQALPFPLPFGWSPLATFHVDLPEILATPADVQLRLTDDLGVGDFLTIVRYDVEDRSWRVLEAGTGEPAQPHEFSFALSDGGTYAAVVRDEGTGAPLPVPLGDRLPAGAAQTLSGRVAAVGLVAPAEKAASLDPDAVTTQAQAVFTPATGVLPSSSWFRIAVQETYDLADGSGLRTPNYDATVFAYRRPAGTIAAGDSVPGGPSQPPSALGEGRPTAVFPMRPQLLFGPSELLEARVHIDVLPPLGDGAAALSAQGGVLESADVRVTVPPAALEGFSAGSLRTLDAAGFSALAGPGQSVVRAFELNLGRLLDGATLQLSLGTALAPETDFVLAQLVRFPGGNGLAPVQRFRTTAAGALTSVEPAAAPRLPGFTGSGQFLLVQLQAPQGLVSGLVTTAASTPAPGIGVRIASQRWLSVTGADARYFLLAPAGAGTALASHPINGDGAAAGFAALDSLDPVTLNLTLGALAPRILATTPPDGVTTASTVSPLTIEISEKIAPASLGATPVALRADGASGDVPGGASLDLSGRFLTFLPTAPLDPGVLFTLTVSSDLRDLQNLALEGPRTFVFTTAPLAARGQGAQLTIYEPGAAGPTPADQALLDAIPGYEPGLGGRSVAAIGSAGSADPEVPVILVNESTGATATVLSRPDGSFANFIEASEEDFISAVFVNANGTRVTLPATRQKFDDGRIGLFRQGGILEAESDRGPVQVIVEPGAVASRTTFRLDPVPLNEVRTLLGNTRPEGGQLLGGVRYEEGVEPILAAADLSFPIRISDLDLPDEKGPGDVGYALTIPSIVGGQTVFHVIDSMEFVADGPEDGRLVTRSPPFIGLLLRQINALRAETPVASASSRITQEFRNAFTFESVLSMMFVPVMLPAVTGQQTAGKVMSRDPSVPDGDPQPVSGAFVRVASNLNLPTTFRAGELFALSETNGSFAIISSVPPLSGTVIATHPRFSLQRATANIGLGSFGPSISRVDVFFERRPPQAINVEDTAAPVVNVLQTPRTAIIGLGPTQGAVLEVTVLDDLQAVTAEVVPNTFFSPLGVPKNIALIPPPELIDEESTGSGARLLRRFRVRSPESGRVVFHVTGSDAAGNETVLTHVVAFGGQFADSDPATPRRVPFSWPPHGSENIPLGAPIILRFTKPITEEMAANPSWIVLEPPGEFVVTSVDLAAGGLEARIRYAASASASASGTFKLTIDPSMAQHFPQVTEDGLPEDDGSSGYFLEFTFAQASAIPVLETGLSRLRGTTLSGNHLIVSGLGPDGAGVLRSLRLVGDAQGGLQMETVDNNTFEDPPSEVVFIPHYPLRLAAGVQPPRDYIAVFTGDAIGSKRMRMYTLEPDGTLTRPFQRNGSISESISLITKAKWDAPYIAYLELSAGVSSVQLLNFNAHATGLEAANLNAFPDVGRNGLDSNNDGDFADAGEIAPQPARRAGEGLGVEFTYAPGNPSEVLVDFDFSADFALLGAVLRSQTGGVFVLPLAGAAGATDDQLARAEFPETPKRVLLLPAQPILLGGVLAQRDVAVVSTVAEAGASGKLVVIDLSNPSSLTILGRAQLPAGAGSANSIVPRGDGLLALATTSAGTVLLDPRFLLETNGGLEFTAAVERRIGGLSTSARAFAADPSGLHAVAEGGQVRAAFTGPGVRLVTFPGVTPFKPTDAVTTLTREQWEHRLTSASTVTAGALADFSQPTAATDPLVHIYALIHAPGLAAELAPSGVPPKSIELAAAAVDSRGVPVIKNESCLVPTCLGNETLTARFAALAAINFAKQLPSNPSLPGLFDTAGRATLGALYGELTGSSPAYNERLFARRLSDVPTSPLYNTYLAGPIVLLKSDLTASQFEQLEPDSSQPLRRYLKASRHFWVGLGPAQPSASPLAPFASRQDEELILNLNLEFPGVVPNLVNLGISIVTALLSGDPLPVILAVTRFVDASLERALVPGANAMADGGIVRRPVVFIGGVMGSTLEDSEGPLWTPSLVGFGTGTITGSLQTRLEGLGFTPEGQPISAMEATDALRRALGKDIYGQFLEYLVGQGGYREYDRKNKETSLYLDGAPNWESLVKNPDFFVFPYDWRQDNAVSAQKLAKYVKLIQAVHPDGSKVNIVAHSMGGLVGRQFIMGNKDKVDQFITIATPFLGAAKTLPAMKYGDFDELAMNVLVPKNILKRVARFLPSIHQLMPNRGYFDLGLRPMKEFGWDADMNGDDAEDYPYEQYREVMDTRLFEIEGQPSTLPITSHNEPLHNRTEPGLGSAYDWRADTSDVRCTHIVGMQSMPKTIQGVRLTAYLEPDVATTDASVDLPAVDFLDTDDSGRSGPGQLLPLMRAATPHPLRLADDTYRLRFGLDLERGGGDGTVPILSQTRGFDATLDFNKSKSRCLPIVSRKADHIDDELASHNGMFANKQLQELVVRVLDEALPEEPTLDVSVPLTVAEGSPAVFSATPGNVPEINTGAPRMLWSPGEGAVVYPGSPVTHVFADNGTYTVTCAVGWETGVGALRSRTITVTNVAPTVTIDGPQAPVPAQTAVFFKALVTDPGQRDTHTYEWDFGDGSDVGAELDADTFAVSHRYDRQGDYTVTLRVTDDDGGAGETQFTVQVVPPTAQAPLASTAQSQSDSGASDEDAAALIETVTLFITGHDVESSDVQILHDDQNVLVTTDRLLRLVESILLDNTVEKGMQITVFRETKGSDGGLPQESEVRFTTDQVLKPISVRLEFRGAAGTRCVTWTASPQSEAQTIALEWTWADLLTADTPAFEAMLGGSFTEKTAVFSPCEDQLPPSINLVRRDTANTWELATQDNFAEPTQVNVYMADLTVLDGEPISEQNADKLTFHRSQSALIDEASTPGRATALAVADPKGNTRVKEAIRTVEDSGIDTGRLNEVREAVLNAFNDAAQEPLFQKMVLHMDHIRIFEQGSGACLWKPNPAKCAAYVPGQSDNDYELLIPLWVNAPFGPLIANPLPPPDLIPGPPVALDPTNPIHFIEFENIAHDPDFMIGDWYFKPPQGTTENGYDLGFAPDPEDKPVYDAWRAAARFWDYEIPDPFSNLGNESGAIQIDRLDPTLDPEIRKLLEHPVPPAELVARLIFLQTQDPVIKEILPDVSFFPFRREHFEFAVMSLERPSPFVGDDPIGDSGAGRGLLLLKWVLEGEFLPADDRFDGFNAGIDHGISQRMRRDVFNRLRDRQDLLAPEGYEWGLYQEFTLLSASIDLRMKTATAATPPADRLKSLPFGDYITAHDKAALKKAGKAAIRGAMARLAMGESTRAELFSVTPEEYDASNDLLSFEDIGAAVAKNHLTLFPGRDDEDFNKLIGAKRGDARVIKPLLATPEKVDEFLVNAFGLLNEHVQEPAAAPYASFIQALTTTGNIAEREARLDNVHVLENGAPTATGSTRPGRLDMHGQGDAGHHATYFLAANIHRRDASTNGPFTVTLSPSGGSSIVCDNIVIPPNEDSVRLLHKDPDGNSVLRILQSVTDNSERNHTIELDGTTPQSNQEKNDTVELTSYFLDLDAFTGVALPPRAGRKILYRGLALDATAQAALVSNELAQRRLLSTTRRRGLADSVGAQNLLTVIRAPQRFNAATGQYTGFFQSFSPADLNLIKDSPEELALAQTGPTTGIETLAISTATRPHRAATAALTKTSPTERALFIVLEVPWPPPPGSGFRYIQTAQTGPGGAVSKQVNAAEDEVVYLGQLDFLKADLYEVTGMGSLPFSYTFQHLGTFQ